MKDLGEVDYILGVKIQSNWSKTFLSLSHETYIKKIFEHFRMYSYKIMDTPVTKSETLSLEMCPMTKKENKDMSRVLYSSVLGSLMYNMICILPDICYVMSLVSKYKSNLIKDHRKVVKRIF